MITKMVHKKDIRKEISRLLNFEILPLIRIKILNGNITEEWDKNYVILRYSVA